MARGGRRPGAGRKPKQSAPEQSKRPPRLNEGRPSKYDPAFCDAVEDKLGEGHSVEACAGYIGVARSTIYEWAEQHPEFSDALKRGQARSAFWWEERLRHVAMNGGGAGAATAVIFGLKNRAPDMWREKSTQELVGKNDGPVQTEVSARDLIAGRLAGLAERGATSGDPLKPDGNAG